jgi:predicted kinase
LIKLISVLFEKYNIDEWSKNDAIPEISRMKKNLAIFIFGPPASGKTTFVKNYITKLNNNFAIVNPDDITYLLQGKNYSNPIRPSGITRLSKNKVKYILNSGNNLIYDTTGNDYERIATLSKIAKDKGYTVIFIHLLDSLNNLISKSKQRIRPTDEPYIRSSYNKTQSLIKQYSNELKPDSYYIITSFDGKYRFFKYENNKLLKKKVDSYV